MAVIRNRQAVGVARDAVALDFGDLAKQGEMTRRAAEDEGIRIVTDARAERQRLIEGARKEGFAAGRKEGFGVGVAEGRAEGHAAAKAERIAELTQLEGAWGEALVRIEAERLKGVESLRIDGIRLAIGIAERVVRGTLAIEPGRVLALAEGAILAAARTSDLLVTHHPDDAALLIEAVPALMVRLGGSQRIGLAADAAVERGSVRVNTAGGGMVDASINTQLARIAECLLPDSGEARPETMESAS